MEKPPKLKVDTELVVNDGPEQPAGEIGGDTTAPVDNETTTQATGETSALVPAEKPAPSPRDQVAERLAKKLADQEFLAAYKKRELFVRVRFVIVALLIVGGFFYSFNKIFDNTRAAFNAQSHFTPVILAAFLGERDSAYYLTSAFPFQSDSPKRPGVLDIRQKILDRSIADLERSGRTAIFSRLGAEQMLISQGERAKGLQYGDYLINKYPGLASNYCWRARVDFERGDFAHAISDYEQVVALLKTTPPEVQKAWRNELPKAVWACIDSGRTRDARHFLDFYKECGAAEEAVQALESQIVLGQYDQMDLENLKKTDLWSADLTHFSDQLLSDATRHAAKLSEFDDEKDEVSIAIALRSHNFAQAREVIDELKRYNSLKYSYTVSTTQLRLYQNDPQGALKAVSKMVEKQPSAELDLLQATALQRLHAPVRTIDCADRGLQWYQTPGTVTGKFYLPLLTIKARALVDIGKQDQALKLCDQVIAANPHMIAAHLLKLQILQSQNKTGQNKQAEVIKEREEISTIVKNLTAGE